MVAAKTRKYIFKLWGNDDDILGKGRRGERKLSDEPLLVKLACTWVRRMSGEHEMWEDVEWIAEKGLGVAGVVLNARGVVCSISLLVWLSLRTCLRSNQSNKTSDP